MPPRALSPVKRMAVCMYRLSELGRKAVATLEFIRKDLDVSVL